MKLVYSKEHETIKFREKFNYSQVMIGGEEQGSISVYSEQVIKHDGCYDNESAQVLILTLPKKVFAHIKTFLDEKSTQMQNGGVTLSSLLGISKEDAERYQVELFAKALLNARELLAKPLSASWAASESPTVPPRSSSSMDKTPSIAHKLSQSFASLSLPSLFKMTPSGPSKPRSTHQVPSADAVPQPPSELVEELASCRQESREDDTISTPVPSISIPGIMY